MPARRVLVSLRWSDMDAYGHVNNVQFLRLLEDARVALFSGPRFRGEAKPADAWDCGVDAAAVPPASAGRSTGSPDAPDHLVLLDGGLLVARAEIEYQRPLEYRLAPVAVDVWVSDVRAADFVLGYRVGDPEPQECAVALPDGLDGAGRPYAVAETTMVPYDLQAGRPRRLRQDELGVLHAWADAPVSFRRRARGGAR